MGSRSSLPLLPPRLQPEPGAAVPPCPTAAGGSPASPLWGTDASKPLGFLWESSPPSSDPQQALPAAPSYLCHALNHGRETIRLSQPPGRDAREPAAPAPQIAQERAAICWVRGSKSDRKSCLSFPLTITAGREAPAFACLRGPEVRYARLRARLCGQRWTRRGHSTARQGLGKNGYMSLKISLRELPAVSGKAASAKRLVIGVALAN